MIFHFLQREKHFAFGIHCHPHEFKLNTDGFSVKKLTSNLFQPRFKPTRGECFILRYIDIDSVCSITLTNYIDHSEYRHTVP